MGDDDDWVDAAAGGLISLFPLVGPLLADPGRRMVHRVREEHARNTSKALAAAERVSGRSREDLAELIAADSRLIPLVTRVLFAAGMTGQDEILNALGAALGAAVSHPEAADETEVLLIGLQDLRRNHLLVLRAAAGPEKWLQMPGGSLDPATSSPADLIEADLWDLDALSVQSGMSVEMAYVAVNGLVNAGFLRASGVTGGMNYRITDFGRSLLEVLDQYGTPASDR